MAKSGRRRSPRSKIFPGTTRDYFVYVPKQYDASKPACLMVFFDGGGFMKADGQFRVPVVFDNLIAKKEMPVTIAVGDQSRNRVSRRCPARKAAEQSQLRIRLARRCQCALPSRRTSARGDEGPATSPRIPRAARSAATVRAASAAFTVAWERPDAFRKVVSHIGSFTNIRGGHVYPALIRKTKPANRSASFLQDGSNDLDNLHGNWPLANQDMAAALKFAGYDYNSCSATAATPANTAAPFFPTRCAGSGATGQRNRRAARESRE